MAIHWNVEPEFTELMSTSAWINETNSAKTISTKEKIQINLVKD